MIEVLQKLARRNRSSRRPRFWRYVSPQRRGIGVILLLLVVSAGSGYWHMTNDARIREQAIEYLESLTGGRASVDRATFSLFDGIRLGSVRVSLPDDDQPMFTASEVVLRHRPWALLFKGAIEVSEISCIDPVVNLTYDVESRSFVQTRFLKGYGGDAHSTPPKMLPVLAVRNGQIRLAEQLEGLRVHRHQYDVNISGFPIDESGYQITLEELTGGTLGTVRIDFSTGLVELLGGSMIDMAGLDRTLLRQYGELKDRYDITGPIAVEGSWDSSSGEGVLVATLRGISLTLPAQHGGLDLHDVEGMLWLETEGITLTNVTGRINADKGKFTINGRYYGYDADSPYDLHIAIDRLIMPPSASTDGQLAEVLRNIEDVVKIDGALDVEMETRRTADGAEIHGQVNPVNAGAMCHYFPYWVDDVTGRISFDEDFIAFDLIGVSEGAEISITGEIDHQSDTEYDVLVVGKDVPLDDRLARAMPPTIRRHFESLSSCGIGNTRVRVRSSGEDDEPRVEVDVELNGKASVQYEQFPYRLENVFAQARIDNNSAHLKFAEASHEGSRLSLDGHVRWRDSGLEDVDLTIKGKVPLDDRLVNALGQDGQNAFVRLGLSGMADHVSGKIRMVEGQTLEHEVVAHVENLSFCDQKLPLLVQNAEGVLIFNNRQLTIKAVNGRYRNSPVSLRGRVDLTGGDELELHVDASDVLLDDQTRNALRPIGDKLWETLAPSGIVDIEADYFRDGDGKVDYRCEIDARDLSLTYAEFPYTFKNIRGMAIVTPSGIELDGLLATDDQMRISVSGKIVTGSSKLGRLKVWAKDIAIDDMLIESMGKLLPALADNLLSGGQCDADFSSIVVELPSSDDDASVRTKWRVEGAVDLKQAHIRLGETTKQVTGRVEGMAFDDGEGIAIDANGFVKELTLEGRLASNIRGKIIKTAQNDILRLDDLVGSAYGGRMAGFGEVHLDETMQYGFRLFTEGIDISKLVHEEGGPDSLNSQVSGLLDATLELKGSVGAPKQASGMLRIFDARIYKLPVLLDMFQPMLLSMPGESPFTEGAAIYHLKDHKLEFTEIFLSGKGMSIVGSGTMNTESEAIKLTFLGRPGLLPRMSGLGSELLEGLLREMVEYQVTGTLSRPRVRTIPLRSIEAILGRLLRPEE